MTYGSLLVVAQCVLGIGKYARHLVGATCSALTRKSPNVAFQCLTFSHFDAFHKTASSF